MLFGKVEGLKKSYLPYEGETYEELIEDFHEAVDSYLEICKRKGITPEKIAIPLWGGYFLAISSVVSVPLAPSRVGRY